MPHMPMPPMPTKWMRWMPPHAVFAHRLRATRASLRPRGARRDDRAPRRRAARAAPRPRPSREPVRDRAARSASARSRSLCGERPRRQHDRGAGRGERARVGALVVVGRVRVGHEQRGQPRHRELGHGQRAAAAQREVALGIARGHVALERHDARGDARRGVGGRDALAVGLAGLVEDLEDRAVEARRRIDHRVVDLARALAAAEHEQTQRLARRAARRRAAERGDQRSAQRRAGHRHRAGAAQCAPRPPRTARRPRARTRAASRFARPGSAFGSTSAIGIRRSAAAITPGTEA